ncbi:MAG TPA: M23 family metallopeptidase [Sphingomicrobium sp.]|nr:M23 family metallopeptidase [Sphingomicrobium sp.]
MKFRTDIRERFRWNGIAGAADRRLLAGAGAGLFCAAAAAVAAVPSASAGTSEPSSSITVAIPKASQSPNTVFADPTDAAVQLFATLQPADSLKALLERSGVAKSDVKTAAAMIAQALPAGVSEGTKLEILLGPPTGKGARRLERLSFQPGQAFRLVVARTLGGNLKLARDAVSVDATPQRFTGVAGSDLFWSLRAAGVPAQSAREYLDALATRVDLRQVGPRDSFDLVIDHMRDGAGKARTGPLLYASLHRQGGRSVDVVRWTVGNRTGWFDPSKPEQRVEGFEQPVRGRVTSRFGYRIHPILRFGRFHDGVDYGAAWGSPVFAAADGIVTGAGWSGGYGRQVRLAHPGGVMTSYAHLSRIVATPGMRVQRGQLIGLVGSSGFSTGAHLHFEVRRAGQPVNPATFRPADVERISATDMAALRARLEQLHSI